MKQLHLRITMLIMALLLNLPLWAETCIGELYYDFDNFNQTATVVKTIYDSSDSKDIIVIPSTVSYNNKTYQVKEIGQFAFRDLYGLKAVKLPETLQVIGSRAFKSCGFETITLPASLQTIGFDAFWGVSLIEVICEAQVPPQASATMTTFSDVTLEKGTLRVPKGSMDAYRTAACWKNFNIIKYIGQIDPTGISMQESLTMDINSTYQLQANIQPSNVTERELTWSSSDPSVVEVKDGQLTAKSTGSATITVKTVNNFSAVCKVTVVQPVTALSIAAVGDLYIGDTRKLNVTITPANATDKTIEFSSSNPGVISVSADGTITALSIGSATITVKAKSGVTASIVLKVVPVEVESISLHSSITINIGESKTLEATVNPTNATYKDLTWSSSDMAVVKVDATGKLTGISIGNTTVTATAHNGVKATVNVSVVPVEITSIELSATELRLSVGKSGSLVATVRPDNATDKTVIWTTSNEEVATVNEVGRVTGVAIGSAVITVSTSNGMTATCTVTVDNPVTSLAIDYEAMGLTGNSVQMKVSEELEIKVIINPEDASDKTLTFISNDPSKVSVKGDGIMTANSVGNAIITISAASGVKTVMNVQVIPTPAESVTLNVEEAEMEVGEAITIVAIVAPATTTDKTLVWKSSAPGVASVDNEGVITPLSVGETTITATASNGVKASAKITVVPTLASSLTVIPISLKLNAGEVATVWAQVSPDNTTDKSVNWTSSDEKVAKVDANGDVTALSAGMAVITAMTKDGSYLTASCDVTVTDYSGIEEILVEEVEGEIFTLSGLKVDSTRNILPGIYIVRKDNEVKKIVIK